MGNQQIIADTSHLETTIGEERSQLMRRVVDVNVEELQDQLARKDKELRAARARLESVLESIADINILFDHEWRYVYVNDAAARAIGQSLEQLLGRTLWEVFPDIIGTDLDRQYRRAMDERVTIEFDFHYQKRDTWWANRFFPTPEGLRVLATEITERKRAEEALHRAHDELEKRVKARTSQLAAINSELLREIAERERAEIELTLVKDELASELNAMNRLHELSTRLLASTELQPLLEEVLEATITLLNADFGNVQLYNPETKVLEIVAQRGFKQDFLDCFSKLSEESTACGRALKQGDRVIVEDVENDPHFAPHRSIAVAAGFRALQSTPLFGRNGRAARSDIYPLSRAAPPFETGASIHRRLRPPCIRVH
jgi:PAS domain S-box-containing protein